MPTQAGDAELSVGNSDCVLSGERHCQSSDPQELIIHPSFPPLLSAMTSAPAAASPSSPSRSLPPFISLRYHTHGVIGVYDFLALKTFEKLHPELYVAALTPRFKGFVNAATVQSAAFDQIFYSQWKGELNQLIEAEKAKRRRRTGSK